MTDFKKTNKKKLSNLVKEQLPSFVLEDHPKFAEFVSAYYLFLESAELQISSFTAVDNILLELEEWAQRVENDQFGADFEYDLMDDDDFADLIKVDKEYMIEEDLAALKEKFKGLAKLNQVMAETVHHSHEEKAANEEQRKAIQGGFFN